MSEEGVMTKGSTIVTEESLVLPRLSVARTVADPVDPGAGQAVPIGDLLRHASRLEAQ